MWGLIIGGIVALVAVGLLTEGRISEKYFCVIMCGAIIVGLCVAYYGSTKKVTVGLDGFSLEAFERQAETIKQNALDEIKKAIVELKTLAQFTVTVTKAQNEDGQAFDRLRMWATEPNYPHQLEAERARAAIVDEHVPPPTSVSNTLPGGLGVDHDSSIATIKGVFSSATVPNRIKILHYILVRKRFSKYERMAFVVDVLRTDDNLIVRQKAGLIFLGESHLNAKPIDKDPLVEWWEENKEEIRSSEGTDPANEH